jgi:hypothetical protein
MSSPSNLGEATAVTAISEPMTHRSSAVTTPLPAVSKPSATGSVHQRTSSAVKSAASSSAGESASSAPRRHLLGQLSVDKSYLENLLQHPGIYYSHINQYIYFKFQSSLFKFIKRFHDDRDEIYYREYLNLLRSLSFS